MDYLAKSLFVGEIGSPETYRPQEMDSFVALTRLHATHGAG